MTEGLTQADVRRIWGRQHCGCCHSQDNLAYDRRCELLLCRHCRQRKTEALRKLTVSARVVRDMGIEGMIVPGTYIPAELGA